MTRPENNILQGIRNPIRRRTFGSFTFNDPRRMIIAPVQPSPLPHQNTKIEEFAAYADAEPDAEPSKDEPPKDKLRTRIRQKISGEAGVGNETKRTAWNVSIKARQSAAYFARRDRCKHARNAATTRFFARQSVLPPVPIIARGHGRNGKTASRLLQCLSLATQRPLTGERVYMRGRVLILTLEDGMDEFSRRLKAAMIRHRIASEEIEGWLFVAAPKGIKLAEMHEGHPEVGRLRKTLLDAIDRLKPDHIEFDPFIKTHGLSENDNSAMDFVCDLLIEIATTYNISIDAPHHARKGNLTPGTPM